MAKSKGPPLCSVERCTDPVSEGIKLFARGHQVCKYHAQIYKDREYPSDFFKRLGLRPATVKASKKRSQKT